VLGVRARDKNADLPTLQIMPDAKTRDAMLNAAPCPDMASGACFAPRPVSVSRFGVDVRSGGNLFIVPGPVSSGPIDLNRASGPQILPVQMSARSGLSTYLTSGGLIPTGQANLTTGPQAIGAINAMATIASGPLATAIARSTVLQNAVMIDSFGHDFRVDLTRAVDTRGYDPTYALMATQFTDVTPFAFGIDSPVGPLFASGYATDTTTPQGVSGLYRGVSDYHQYDLRDFRLGVTVAPGIDLNLGYHLDMGGAFNNYDAAASVAYDGLFMGASAVNSPYASLANGGTFIGSTIALADDLHLRFGEISLSPEREPFNINSYSMVDQLSGPRPLYDLRAARGSMAGVSWDFASWGGLGVTATQVDEKNGLLGGYGSGALSIADSANTTALGVSARIGFGDGWVTTASYSEGITQLDLKPSSLFSSATDLHSRAYGIAVAKHGLFGEDSLGFAVTRPIQIYSGSAEITAADGVDANNDLVLNRERISLAGIKSETDIELGYVTTFLDGALALQANAAYQMNTQGQSGNNSLAVVSRAKIKF